MRLEPDSVEFNELVTVLAKASTARFFTATVKEGKDPIEAMEEIVRVLLEEYRNAVAS